MNDLQGKLERLADRVDGRPSPDLHTARERHERRRTRSALAVGLVVAFAAGALVVSALPSSDEGLRNPSPTVAAWTPPDPITLWPESPITAETPEEAQGRVDAGEDQWRLDPEQVITRFAQNVLGWSEPSVTPWLDRPGVYEVLPEVCPANARCPSGIEVSVVQPSSQGEAGIWSIAEVSNPDLVIDVAPSDPGSALTAGSYVSFDVTLPAGRTAHAGAVAANGCAQTGATGIALETGTTTITLPYASGDDPSCADVGAGYVYVYAMDDTTVPEASDPITQPAAIEYPYLTVVPIYVQMESGEVASATPVSVANSLNVTCTGMSAGTTIDTRVVAAGPGGVRVTFAQPAGDDQSVPETILVFDARKGDPHDGIVRIANSAEGWVDLPPGAHTVGCGYEGDIVVGEESFEVVDPNGYWTDPSVDCAPPGDEADLDADAIAVEGDPNDELLAAGDAILTSALGQEGPVTFGGYPEAMGHRIAVRHDEGGSVVGRVDFTLNGQDWFPDSYVTCEGTTIT